MSRWRDRQRRMPLMINTVSTRTMTTCVIDTGWRNLSISFTPVWVRRRPSQLQSANFPKVGSMPQIPVRAKRLAYGQPVGSLGAEFFHQATKELHCIHLECPSVQVMLEPSMWRVAWVSQALFCKKSGGGGSQGRAHSAAQKSAKAIRPRDELASGWAPSANMTYIAGSAIWANRNPPLRSSPSMFQAMEMKLRSQSGVQCHQPVRKCSGQGAG